MFIIIKTTLKQYLPNHDYHYPPTQTYFCGREKYNKIKSEQTYKKKTQQKLIEIHEKCTTTLHFMCLSTLLFISNFQHLLLFSTRLHIHEFVY